MIIGFTYDTTYNIEKRYSRCQNVSRDLRFDELCKVLESYGYEMNAPRDGSSHYTFRKPEGQPITIPRHEPIKKVYEEGFIRYDYDRHQKNGRLIQLYLYLSRLQWERGYHDDAFASLDLALEHAKELEADSARAAEAPVKIAELLPGDWPWWCNPGYSQVEKEIKADPTWAEWVERTKE